MLSTHLHLGFPSGLCPFVFPTTNLYIFLFSPHAHSMPRPPHPPRLDNSNYTCWKSTNHAAFHYVVSTIVPSPLSSLARIFPQHPVLKHPQSVSIT
jgi:hypothetical protein